MKQKKIIANIGQFTEEKGETFYVDKQGKVWSQQMMADLVSSHRAMKQTIDFIAHYKKFLE